MCTIDQLKRGLSAYVEKELVGKISGLRKWGLALFASPIIANVDSMMQNHKDFLKTAGFMTEDGMIKIDELYSRAREVASKEGDVVENIPLLGDVKFTESDITALYRYITGNY